jgi:asparagine synthase (glutamine-hydrolysing)
MCNEDQTVWLVINGEIYNYKVLRETLRAKGHTFKSESDSEIAIHMYEEYGDSFVEELRGMFALAVYDQTKKRLLLARDPSGKKPLYYAIQDRKLVFGSEIKALLAGGVAKSVNYEAIPTYLMYQYVLGEDTLFKNIKKLKAGHILTVHNHWLEVAPIQYWTISDKERCPSGKAVEKLTCLLNESVKLRLQSDVPVGAFLSGGIDSSAVVALWRKQSPENRIHTFTASFGEWNTEEGWAKQVSKHLGTEYHEIEITSRMVADNIDKITWHHDEPLGDAATINNYFLAKEAKKWVTVVLAGEGGDEIFGGYPWHKYSTYTKMMNWIPEWSKKLGQQAVWAINRGDPTSNTHQMNRIALFPTQSSTQETLLYPTTAMSQQNVKWLLGRERCESSCYRYAVPNDMMDHYNQTLATDYLNLLPEKFLMKADKGTMAWGVEERLPLLDQEVVKLAFQIEPCLKTDKWVLRKAIESEKMLPKDIVWRPKQGFGTPVAEWLHSDEVWKRVVDSLIKGELLAEVCKPEAREKLAKWFVDQDVKNTQQKRIALSTYNVVWGLFTLQTWHDVWFGDSQNKVVEGATNDNRWQ